MARFYWITSYGFLGLLVIERKKWTSLGYESFRDFWHSKTLSCGHLAYGLLGWCLIVTDIPFSSEFLSEIHGVKSYFFILFWPCSPSRLSDITICWTPPSPLALLPLPSVIHTSAFSYWCYSIQYSLTSGKEKESLHFSFVGYVQ